MKLPLVLPDVNCGEYMFTVNDAGEIVYGLGAVKGVGEGPIDAIVAARQDGGEFKDLFDFCDRVGVKNINKRVLEALVRCGALDKLGASRAVLMAAIPDAVKAADQNARNQDIGIGDLFGAIVDSTEEQAGDVYESYQGVEEWTDKERLNGEKDTLGLYVTGHPIDEYEKELRKFVHNRLVDLKPAPRQSQKMAGLVIDVRLRKTKRGDTLAFITLDDRSARIDITLFGEAYDKARNMIVKDAVLIVEGEVAEDHYSGGIKVKGSKVLDIPQARAQYARSVEIACDASQLAGRRMKELADILAAYRGDGSLPVTVRYRGADALATVQLGEQWAVQANDDLIIRLMDQFGGKAVALRY